MSTDLKETRDEEGKFLPGQSGNPLGRPVGSKNKVTLLKIMGEEAVRDNNFDDMLKVCAQTVKEALAGDKQARKMVWETMTSKGIQEQSAAAEKVTITINDVHTPKSVVIEGEKEDGTNRSESKRPESDEQPSIDTEFEQRH
jgi:hypothetical protein